MEKMTAEALTSSPNSAENRPLIDLRGVGLSLGGSAGRVDILRGVDLSIRRGEIVGLVGPSGSGKTTLLMVLGGLERPDSGTARVAGVDLSAADENALAAFRRNHLGIVFQSFQLLPTMTALENVAVPLELAGAADARARARAALEAVGLGHRLTHYPGQLSGGEQQRVAIARAFAPRPALILADEPTGNLDSASGAKVVELLFGLAAEHGTALLLITHDPALAARCGRILRMEDGRLKEAA